MKRQPLSIITLFMMILAGVLIMKTCKTQPEEETTVRDYDEIVASGTLRAVTGYNEISYFAQADTVSGFQYEMLQAFAKAHGLRLDIKPVSSFSQRLNYVWKGQYDILANNTPTTSKIRRKLHFTRPILMSRQVLVQRSNDSTHIKSHLQLAGREVWVTKDSPAILRLENLAEEIADTIVIKKFEGYGSDQLPVLVASGDIDYAVCDWNLAAAALADYPVLDIGMDIGFTQFYAWGVNKMAPELLEVLNVWLDEYIESTEFKNLLKKYNL